MSFTLFYTTPFDSPPPDKWQSNILLDTKKASDKQIGGQHYKNRAIQPERYAYENNLGWHEGEAVKYVTRWKDKNGKEDLEKAIHVLQLLLENLNGKV